MLRLAISRFGSLKPLPEPGVLAGTGLRKCLKLHDIIGFGLGVTVGGGVFVATGAAAQEAGPAVLLSFLLAAFGCGCTGLCYAELSLLAPSAGSSYTFAYHAIGEFAAFAIGTYNIAGNILSGAAVARGWAAYVSLLVEEVGLVSEEAVVASNGWAMSPLALGLVLLVGALNLLGTRATSIANGAVTAVSVALLLGYVLLSAPFVDPARWRPFFASGFSGVLRGSGTVFFAYLGFDLLTCLSEEAEDARVVPRGIVCTLLISTAIYAATAAAFTGLVAHNEIEADAPLASAARLRGLDALAVMISLGAVGNTLTTVIGSVVGGPRVCFVMAQDGLVPARLATVNKRGAPVLTLAVTVLPMAACAGFMEFGALADIVSAGALITFSTVCACLVLLRCSTAPGGSDSAPAPLPTAAAEPGTRGSPTVVGRRATAAEEGGDGDQAAPPATADPDDVALLQDTAATLEAPPGLGRALAAYGASCFLAAVLLRMPSDHAPGGSVAALAAGGGAAAALVAMACACFVVSKVRCGPGDAGGVTPAMRSRGGRSFQLPFAPFIPLTGILVNALLLSEMPLASLLCLSVVYLGAFVLYVAYAAPSAAAAAAAAAKEAALAAAASRRSDAVEDEHLIPRLETPA